LYKEKEKKEKKEKEWFYELRPIKKDSDRCAKCDFPLAGPEALYIALGVTGPFCRIECMAKANDLKGKFRKGTNAAG